MVIRSHLALSIWVKLIFLPMSDAYHGNAVIYGMIVLCRFTNEGLGVYWVQSLRKNTTGNFKK